MRLRKQLFFISLITLVLPWVGVQYVQEMDSALRRGQQDALLATARAVGARLSTDSSILVELEHFSPSQMTDKDEPHQRPLPALYAHALHTPLVIDGYNDDWISRALQFETINTSVSSPQYMLARANTHLFLFLRSHRKNIQYFNPRNTDLTSTDHIILTLADASQIAVFASAPGQIKATQFKIDSPININQNAHQIRGIWTEWEHGFDVELSLPLTWVKDGFNFNSVPAAESLTHDPDIQLRPLITPSQSLSEELSIFASNGIKLSLASNSKKLIASSGRITTLTENEKQHGFLEWLYSIILQNKKSQALDSPSNEGEFKTEDVQLALSGEEASGWYQMGPHQIARVSTPIFNPSTHAVIGAVVAEKSADTLASVTNSAFSRLLGFSFLASCAAAFCLVTYATWLSIRIKRLSKAAANAISESGKVAENFPVSNNVDEVGELSRSFAQLLMRLREYTNYLRTLSSKLSHELRTPLAIVKTSLDNLEHEKLSSQAKVYAERAKEGSMRLSNILNSMSAASRVEQAIGAAELEIIPCDELLRSLKDAYEDVYPHVKFSLRIQKQKGGLKMLGSGELIVQLLDKLVDNAADFCPADGLVELGLYQHGEMIVFTVRNEGPPLPQHMQNQLFDSMVSVREDATPEEKGHHLGLGLYIVRLIADFHRGEVQGYNVPDNSGVIFEVRFPSNT